MDDDVDGAESRRKEGKEVWIELHGDDGVYSVGVGRV